MNELNKTKKLFGNISNLIISRKNILAKSVNSTMVLLYWNIRKVIQEDIIMKRADYGEVNCKRDIL